ncbi:hypothetical protein JOQ06_013218 [Pogonophryne albipinna]|uniref:Coiled-coil domain-containing protein 106-like n=1 Tax=Pogonophryne albipinna TaxID=1090488 RepID=A0AAD6FSY8_9TELE|nr:hypothetical protein JOQ06_013218 [Pogonophryne albipinna]
MAEQEQLVNKKALALKKEKGGELTVKIPPGGQTSGQRKEDSDESDLSSSTDSSDSDTESSEDKKPKKKKSKSKRKSQKKIRKNMRVKTPDHSIRRYNMVLEMVRDQGISKAEAYTRLGVDRNTIVYQAPIAEIAAVNPELYKTLRSSFKRKDSIKRFAETCRGFCKQEPTASAILKHKDTGSLLDIHRK